MKKHYLVLLEVLLNGRSSSPYLSAKAPMLSGYLTSDFSSSHCNCIASIVRRSDATYIPVVSRLFVVFGGFFLSSTACASAGIHQLCFLTVLLWEVIMEFGHSVRAFILDQSAVRRTIWRSAAEKQLSLAVKCYKNYRLKCEWPFLEYQFFHTTTEWLKAAKKCPFCGKNRKF